MGKSPAGGARFLSLLLASLWLVLAGCRPLQTASPDAPWEYTDLRALAPAGEGLPSLDIIALYTRAAGPDLQIRLDLLDLSPAPDSDLFLALDWIPGGSRALPLEAQADLEWDALLALPAFGQPYVLVPQAQPAEEFTPFPALIPRITRLPWQDTIVVSFNPVPLPGIERGFSVQAFIAPAGQAVPADSLGPLRSDARPPGRTPVLLAFWNAFPGYTPAQALRRWDGAHTGPFGGRHGLHVLLQAARRWRVPLALLDLKTPESLSALDYLDGLGLVHDLEGQDLLILPDALPGSPSLVPSAEAFPGWMVARAARESRQAGLDFSLPASPILYSPSLELLASASPAEGLPPYTWIVAPLPEPQADAQPLRWKTSRLLPLPPAESEQQATPDGLSLKLRLALLANALAAGQGQETLLVLGGDLVESAWGEPQSARASLQYLAAHPWIQPYGKADLLALRPLTRLESGSPPSAVAPFSQSGRGSVGSPGNAEVVPLFITEASSENLQVPVRLIEQLAMAHNSPAFEPTLSRAAWQAYRALFAPLPPEHPLLPALRAGYTFIPRLLLEAANWAAKPEPRSGCDLDLGLEGRAGCLLSSERVFSAYDPLGGRLLALFVYSPDRKIHQLVAPTSQFIVGFGDPSTWDPTAGPGAEPAGLHGAFADAQPPWEMYLAGPGPHDLAFTSPGGRLAKTFILLENGLRVEYRISGDAHRVQIPIALDPWERFTPSWGERYEESGSDQDWVWRLEGGPQVEVRTSAALRAALFSDSRMQLRKVEDPNFPYPPGHYLPFSLAVIEAQAIEDFFLEITLLD